MSRAHARRVPPQGDAEVTGVFDPDATTQYDRAAAEGPIGTIWRQIAGDETADRAARAARRAELMDRVRAVRVMTLDVAAIVAALIIIAVLLLVGWRIYTRTYFA